MKTSTVYRPLAFVLFAGFLGVASGNALRKDVQLESPESVGSDGAAHQINRRGTDNKAPLLSLSLLGDSLANASLLGLAKVSLLDLGKVSLLSLAKVSLLDDLLKAALLKGCKLLALDIVGNDLKVTVKGVDGKVTMSTVLSNEQKKIVQQKLYEINETYENIEIENNEYLEDPYKSSP